MMKIVYRYIVEDVELRNTFAQSNTLQDFRNACQMLRERLPSLQIGRREIIQKNLSTVSENEFILSWYNRHRTSQKDGLVLGNEDHGDSCYKSNKTGPKLPFSAVDEEVLEDALSIFNM